MVAVVHNNHSLDSFRGRVSICGQLKLVSFITGDCELDKANVGEGVIPLRIRRVLLILLGFEDDFHFSLFGQREIVLVLIYFALHVNDLLFNMGIHS